MLEDRGYMRRSPFDARRSATVTLILVLVAAFIAQKILERFSSPILAYLPLSVDGLRHGFVWQLLSFQFLHAGWLHLFGNCLAIYFFGRDLEETLGTKRFLGLYFLSGIVGGLVQALFGVLLDGRFAGPVVGASAGAFGLIAAFVTLYPERPITMLAFFIIPISMRAKVLLLFEGIVAMLGIFGLLAPGVAHAAHLGGILTGIVFIRYAPYWRWPQFNRSSRQPVRRMAKVVSPKGAFWGRSKDAADEEVTPDEFLRKEVDPILDKISAHGIQSLTERERRILEMARERMAKR